MSDFKNLDDVTAVDYHSFHEGQLVWIFQCPGCKVNVRWLGKAKWKESEPLGHGREGFTIRGWWVVFPKAVEHPNDEKCGTSNNSHSFALEQFNFRQVLPDRGCIPHSGVCSGHEE